MSEAYGTVFKIGELAEYLKISKSTLYKLAQEGKLPGQKAGKHWRFHREIVEEWLGMSGKRAPRIPKLRGGG